MWSFLRLLYLSPHITLSYPIIAVFPYTTPIKPLKDLLPSFPLTQAATQKGIMYNKTSVCRIFGTINFRCSLVTSNHINLCISTPSCTSYMSHEFQNYLAILLEVYISSLNGLLPDSSHFSIGLMPGSASCFFLDTIDV